MANSKEFDLPSGTKFSVTPADFADAAGLNKALMRCMKSTDLGEWAKSIKASGGVASLLNLDVNVLKDALLEAMTSDALEAQLFKCLERCVYGGNTRVTKALFDDPSLGEKARQDYFSMAWRVVEVNCSPFFAQALSWLKTLRPTNTPGRESA